MDTMKEFLGAVAQNHQAYEGQIVVVKFGGEIYDDHAALTDLLEQVRILQVFGARVALVHGGAKQIDALCNQRNIPIRKEAGERICDMAVLEASYDALKSNNSDIVVQYNQLTSQGAGKFEAQGMGAHEGLIKARARTAGQYTGDIVETNTLAIKLALEAHPHRIFVIHPICQDIDNPTGVINVNADYVATALAVSLGAKRLILCTNTAGVVDTSKELTEEEQHKAFTADDPRLIRSATPSDVDTLIQNGIIQGGMIPKVRSLVNVVEQGVEGAVILDPHSLARELFTTQGAGTLIKREAPLQLNLAPQN